ncbi:polysulfide reductase NrfD, partial [bacterium]|nr:polysulfide reductase NrfD [bacterium]
MLQKFETIEGRSIPFYLLLAVLALFAIAGILATYLLCKEGLYLTGMTTRVPWGLQIILAVFYVGLSAGSLVISSLYAIFGKIEYKPFARVTVFLSFLFLVAALLSIISDWGRPQKIFEPFCHFNPISMFSINPFLYTVYMIICIFYLLALFKEKERLIKIIAPVAVIWAIGVHSGTGAIFGFVGRELYCSPLLPPSFIAAALSSGTGFMIIMILVLFRFTNRPLENELVVRLGRLLA